MAEEKKASFQPAEPVDAVGMYANGFQLNITNADLSILLRIDNAPIAEVHMSYTLGKTLYVKLKEVVDKFEQAVQREMLTTDQINEALKSLREPEKAAARVLDMSAAKDKKIDG